MNRNILIAFVCTVLVCVAGVLVWRLLLPPPVEPVKPTTLVQPQPAAPVPPQPVAPAAQVTPEPPAAEAKAEPAPAPAEAYTRPFKLTAETLAGTTWGQGVVKAKFLPDGRWEMNGRIVAKWEVQGDRVRIYDDKGEEHFCDIVGDTLEYNGEKLGRTTK